MTTAFLAESMRARGYRVVEGPATPISGGAADSRLTQPGDLFAAFRGERLDGNYLRGPARDGRRHHRHVAVGDASL